MKEGRRETFDRHVAPDVSWLRQTFPHIMSSESFGKLISMRIFESTVFHEQLELRLGNALSTHLLFVDCIHRLRRKTGVQFRKFQIKNEKF